MPPFPVTPEVPDNTQTLNSPQTFSQGPLGDAYNPAVLLSYGIPMSPLLLLLVVILVLLIKV